MAWEKIQSKIDRGKLRIGSFGLGKVNQKVGRNAQTVPILTLNQNP